MYATQIRAASKNINLITVAGCHCTSFLKYKLVLCSSEIWNWKLGTSIIYAKGNYQRSETSGVMGGKKKEKEIFVASPRKARKRHPTRRDWKKRGGRRRDISVRLRLHRCPALQTQRIPCHLRAATKGSPQYLSDLSWRSRGLRLLPGPQRGCWVSAGKQSLEGTGDPKAMWAMLKGVVFRHALISPNTTVLQLCSKAQFVS